MPATKKKPVKKPVAKKTAKKAAKKVAKKPVAKKPVVKRVKKVQPVVVQETVETASVVPVVVSGVVTMNPAPTTLSTETIR